MRWLSLAVGCLFLVGFQGSVHAANSVVVESKTVDPGATGVQVGVYIANDVSLGALTLPLEIREVTPGSFTTGSFSFVVQGRVASSGLMDFPTLRVLGVPAGTNSCSGPTSQTYSTNNPADFVSPDGVFWAGVKFASPCLAAGSDGIPGVGTPSFRFTFNVTAQEGTFEIDTCCVTPANHLLFLDCSNNGLQPAFTPGVIQIGGAAPQTLVAIESRYALTNEENVTIAISISNDVGLEGFVLPLVARSVSGGAFWTNMGSSLDTLPWYGRLSNSLTDSRTFDKLMVDGVTPDPFLLSAARGTGFCLASGPLESMITLRFDVGSNAGSFEIDTAFFPPASEIELAECGSGTPVPPNFVKGIISVDTLIEDSSLIESALPTDDETVVYSILRDDFDGDENLDIALTGILNLRQAVYFGDGEGGFTPPLYLAPDNLGSSALTSGFVNADEFPDLIGVEDSEIRVNLSNGDRTFGPAIVTLGSFGILPGIACGHVNGDAHLDLVIGSELGGKLYLGNGSGTFVMGGSIASGSFHIAGLTDLNDDGNLDAIFVGNQVQMLLGNGSGGFVLSHVEVLSGSSFNIQVSTAGNFMDFNKDGLADFILTQPRAGGQDSDLHILFGDGNGGVAGHLVRPVGGTCYPAYVLDYNYDGNLDIAVGSSSADRIYIISGDGTGTFSHTASLVTSPAGAVSLTAGDFREDGRWDFAVGDAGGATAAFLNSGTPFALRDSQMVSLCLNDVRARVTNPQGLTSSELGTAIPGARVAIRDADSNAVLDQQINDLNLQDGVYDIAIWRTPNATGTQHYTFAIGINGHQERVFARNAAVPAPGDTFHFAFPFGENLDVFPETGGFASSLQPTFDWSQTVPPSKSAVQYSFELDDYWDFASPEVVESTLTQPMYSPTSPLMDDSLYYWRTRSKDGGGWGPYSHVYAVNTRACDCTSSGDLDQSSTIDAVDLAIVIDIVFFGQPDVQDQSCHTTRADFDCNDLTDAVDLALLIDHVFFGGAGPCDGCL